jgi:hypothetical protein
MTGVLTGFGIAQEKIHKQGYVALCELFRHETGMDMRRIDPAVHVFRLSQHRLRRRL